MKLVFLSDNNGTDELAGEWGLSVWIEFEGHKILLDAGGSDLFLTNARKLGVPVEEAQFCVLSHAHWDHGDGLEAFNAAVEAGVAFVPGTHFYPGGGHLNTLRLNFSMCDIPTIEKGMEKLGGVISGM